MPRPAPVTSARLPSRRNDGVSGRSIRTLSCHCERSEAIQGQQAPRSRLLDCFVATLLARAALRSGRRVADVAAAVAAHAHVRLLGMAEEAFQHAQPRAVFADLCTCFVGKHLLIGAGLQKLADPKAAGIA